jgi:uncharacterized membrane protein YgcG
MRLLATLLAVLSLIGVAACSRSGDDSGQARRSQSGPYIGNGDGGGGGGGGSM